MSSERDASCDAFIQVIENLFNTGWFAVKAHPEAVVDEALRKILPLRDGTFRRPWLLKRPLAVLLGGLPPIAVIET